MDVHDQIPVVQGHFFEALVAENARIVDQDVDGAEFRDGIINNGFCPFAAGHRRFVGDGDAPGLSDFIDHHVGHIAGTNAIAAAAQVIDHDLGAALSEL